MVKEAQPIRSVRGTRDLLPPETARWLAVEEAARRTFAAYNFEEIRTPILEQTALFARSVGTETDIVRKEMYTFDDRGEESLALRPEATASVVRAAIEHGLLGPGAISKLYYLGPMFRRERPQKGRYRQFYQIGAEVLGSDLPAIDVEALEMLVLLLEQVGVATFTLLINSLGCFRCRPGYLNALSEALQSVKGRLCADCQRRAQTNPLRVFDCKVTADQAPIDSLPKMVDFLCSECREHFEQVRAGLDARDIVYQVAPRLVRGLDYYTRTTFEIVSEALGAQNAILGGGRYDGLSEILGGPPAPGFGFAIGEDRLILVAEASRRFEEPRATLAHIAWLDEQGRTAAFELGRRLRRAGLAIEVPYTPVKLKKALSRASREGARFTIIIGEAELANGRYQVKDMAAGTQEALAPGEILPYLESRRGGDRQQPAGERVEA